jgi:hypothetical protein
MLQKAGCGNHLIHVTKPARHKRICASSERRAATDARRVRLPKLRGASFPPETAQNQF